MLIKEAKQKLIIPKDYWEFFRDDCPLCKSELEITENRKKIWCPNIRCPIRLAYRAEDMLSNFGVKGIGFSYCLKMIIQNKYKSHLSILVTDPENHPKEFNADVRLEKAYAIRKIFNQVYTYKELVGKIALPGIGEKTAINLFKGVSSYDDMVDGINRVGGNLHYWIISRINADISAIDFMRTITEFAKELKALSEMFKVKPDAKRAIPIVITGEVTRVPGANRKSFPKYLEEISDGQMEFNVGKAFASARWVVADANNGSASYRAGQDRGILTTSDKLVEWVKKEVGYEHREEESGQVIQL